MPFQKVGSIPTMNFQARTVSFLKRNTGADCSWEKEHPNQYMFKQYLYMFCTSTWQFWKKQPGFSPAVQA